MLTRLMLYACLCDVVKVFSKKYHMSCPDCKQTVMCIATHLLLYCSDKEQKREELWIKLFSILGDDNYNNFISMTPHGQILELLSGCISFRLVDHSRVICFKMCLKYIHTLCKSLVFMSLS